MIRTIKPLIVSCLGLACVLFSGCEPDYIEVNNRYYQNGGIGTTPTAGAVEFHFDFSGFLTGNDFVEVSLYPYVGTQLVEDYGARRATFSFLAPGIYDFDIIEYSYSPGISTSVGYSFSQGGFGTTYSSYYGGSSYGRDVLRGYVEIVAGETLVVEVDL